MNRIIFFCFEIIVDVIYNLINYKRKKCKSTIIINYITKNINVEKLNFDEVKKNKINCENICNKRNVFKSVEVNNIIF